MINSATIFGARLLRVAIDAMIYKGRISTSKALWNCIVCKKVNAIVER